MLQICYLGLSSAVSGRVAVPWSYLGEAGYSGEYVPQSLNQK